MPWYETGSDVDKALILLGRGFVTNGLILVLSSLSAAC